MERWHTDNTRVQLRSQRRNNGLSGTKPVALTAPTCTRMRQGCSKAQRNEGHWGTPRSCMEPNRHRSQAEVRN